MTEELITNQDKENQAFDESSNEYDDAIDVVSNDVKSFAKLRTRLLAITYDFLIILLITTVVVVVIQIVLIGDNQLHPDHIMNKILKPLWFIPGFFYLGYYWTKKGQTPSMRVWKIKAVDNEGKRMSWSQAFIRYVSCFLGFGVVLCLFNKKRHALQDKLSKTYIVYTDEYNK